ncbi:MAG: leucine-rich repeat protein [Defluviitaleaceae bacterium]|nr:leucine-rich repeat protein [Defluviitaleaceae bacterium]MCL2262367.1 leucine-rich repeat protein [Defluviitaleaceae bacterium]
MKRVICFVVAFIMVAAVAPSDLRVGAGGAEPRLSGFVVHHGGQSVAVTGAGQTGQLSAVEGEPFTFEVQIENADIVQSVYVVSEHYRDLRRLEAFYDGAGQWIAKGFFCDTDSFLYGVLSVEFTEDISSLFDGIVLDFSEEIDFNEVRSFLEPEWRNAFITEHENITTIVLDNEEQTELEIEVTNSEIHADIDDLIAMGFAPLEDINGDVIFVRMTGELANEGDIVEFEIAAPMAGLFYLCDEDVQPQFVVAIALTTVKIAAKTAPKWFPKVAAPATFASNTATGISLGMTVSGSANRHRDGVDPRLNTIQTVAGVALTVGGGENVTSIIATALAGEFVKRLHYINQESNTDIFRHLQSIGFDGRSFAGGSWLQGHAGVMVSVVAPSGEFTYRISSNQATVTGFTGRATTLVIPQILGGFPVTSIDTNAFYRRNDLVTVVIPDTVLRISSGAFRHNTNLTSVTLPMNLQYLGWASFGDTGLTSIFIPRRLNYASSWVTPGAFANTPRLRYVTFEEGITRIIPSLFQDATGIREIIIPDTVTEIGNNAFSNATGLVSVVIPNSVTTFGTNIFSGATSLERVVLPDNLQTIPWGMFQNCTSLQEITLPQTLRVIEGAAFRNAHSLEEIIFPNGLQTIGAEAFYNAHSLREVVIPASVTEVDVGAFQNATSLESARVYATGWVGMRAFYNNTAMHTLYFADTVNHIGSGVARGNINLENLSLGQNIAWISSDAFAQNHALVDVTIPRFTTHIQWEAFAGSFRLRNVFIPPRVEHISADAFSFPAWTTIHGLPGSAAETFARARDMEFVPVIAPITSIAFRNEEVFVPQNRRFHIPLDIQPVFDTDTLTFSSSDTSVVTVNHRTGEIGTGGRIGTAVITVTNGYLSASVTVNVVTEAILRNHLADLIEAAKALRAATAISPDGRGIPPDNYWATQAAHNDFSQAILAAIAALE